MNNKFLLVGAGRMAAAHYKAALNLGLELAGVCDLNEASLKQFSVAFNLEESLCFLNLQEMLEKNVSPSLVVVATTADAHRDAVVAAARWGAERILCEKPMAPSLEQCDEMIEACEKAGSLLAINHQMRFMPQYQKVKDEIITGDHEALCSMTVVAGCFGMAMNGSHYIEAFRWLTQSSIETVWSRFDDEEIKSPRGPNFFDASGEICCMSTSGKRLIINAGFDQGHGMTVVYATRNGHIFVDELAGTKISTCREREFISYPAFRYGMPWSRSESVFCPPDNVGPTEAVMRSLITGDGYPSGYDGREICATLVGAWVSSESGGKPVTIEESLAYRDRVFAWA